MEEKNSERVKTTLHNLMAKGIWPMLLALSLIFFALGLNNPGISFTTFTSILYLGFIIAIVSTIYFVYR